MAARLRCYFRFPDLPISGRKFRRKLFSGGIPAEFRYVTIFPAGTFSKPVTGSRNGIPVLTGIYFIPVFIVGF
jgi:hypothetical protein